jgi:glycosyltransferase involved in cell wall biosynthesis
MPTQLVLVSDLAFYPIHWEALRELCERYDVDATVVAHPPPELPDVHRRLGDAGAAPVGNLGIDVCQLKAASTIRLVLHLRRLFGAIRPQAVWIQQEPLDRLALATLAALRLRRRGDSRVVIAACENILPRFSWRRRLVIRFLWARIDAIAAVASPSAGAVLQTGLTRHVATESLVAGALAPPAQVERAELPWPEDSFVIGFVGRIVREKGVRVLLDALDLLPEKFRLLVAGAGPLEDELARRGSRVVHLGLVDHDRLWAVYAAMDCLVLPSLTTDRWKEQFGGVLADAMSMGVPIVGSDSGAIPEVIGDAGLVVPEGSAAMLADAIAALAADAGRRVELGLIGRRRFAERFAIPAYADALARLLGLGPRAEDTASA